MPFVGIQLKKKFSDCVSDSDMALVIKQLEKVIKNVRQESDITLKNDSWQQTSHQSWSG